MRKSFKSRDFIFRPTAMAAALVSAGSEAPMTFAREPKVSGPRGMVSTSVPGAFGKGGGSTAAVKIGSIAVA